VPVKALGVQRHVTVVGVGLVTAVAVAAAAAAHRVAVVMAPWRAACVGCLLAGTAGRHL